MPHWKYRAFDHKEIIYDGVIEADNFVALAVELRQRGLQVIEAIKLHPNDKLAMQRLEKLRNTVDEPQDGEELVKPQIQDKARIRRWWSSLISLFRRS